MSKFFVGQRVRIVCAESFPEMIGSETHITALDQSGYSILKQVWREGLLRIDLQVDKYPGVHVCVLPEWVEPILPEGSAPSEYTFQQLMNNLQEVMA
ncbi:hypothetical protein ACN9MD_09645 [Stenotrophomonas maltophilia]|uniref:hypothetical protein n=1 Tax=Stenotrophomonas maltophilia TaxID=40324 RepID=UPI003CF55622